jgi:amidohydrolase
MGHACGHNIIAAAALGVACALGPLTEDLGITLKIMGTPAEEGGGGKIYMLERGAFDGVDLAMMIHPGPVDVARAEPFAVAHLKVDFHGHAAHAAAYPDEGVNAADAFTVSQVALGLLRQQLPTTVRVHGIVTSGGEAPNSIPEDTSGRWYVRAGTLSELDEIEPRVRRCFEAGALATGASLHIEEESPRYGEFQNDEALLSLFLANAWELGRGFEEMGAAGRMNRASTDMGNVSASIPSIHPYLGIDSLPAVNHQPAFAQHCVGESGDRAVLDGATLMAMTVVDVATDEVLRRQYLRRR